MDAGEWYDYQISKRRTKAQQEWSVMKAALRVGRIHLGAALILFMLVTVVAFIKALAAFWGPDTFEPYFLFAVSLIGLCLFIVITGEVQKVADTVETLEKLRMEIESFEHDLQE